MPSALAYSARLQGYSALTGVQRALTVPSAARAPTLEYSRARRATSDQRPATSLVRIRLCSSLTPRHARRRARIARKKRRATPLYAAITPHVHLLLASPPRTHLCSGSLAKESITALPTPSAPGSAIRERRATRAHFLAPPFVSYTCFMPVYSAGVQCRDIILLGSRTPSARSRPTRISAPRVGSAVNSFAAVSLSRRTWVQLRPMRSSK
eukprot:IDg14698t1